MLVQELAVKMSENAGLSTNKATLPQMHETDIDIITSGMED